MGWKFAKNCGMTTQISWPKSDSLLRSVPIITYTEDTNGRVSLDKDCGASYNEMKGMIYRRKEKISLKLLAFLKH